MPEAKPDKWSLLPDELQSLPRLTVTSQPPMSDDDLWRQDKAFNVHTLDDAVTAFFGKQISKPR